MPILGHTIATLLGAGGCTCNTCANLCYVDLTSLACLEVSYCIPRFCLVLFPLCANILVNTTTPTNALTHHITRTRTHPPRPLVRMEMHAHLTTCLRLKQGCAAPEKSNGSRDASNSSIGGSGSIRDDDAGREDGINVARHIRVKALATLTLLIECVNHGVTVASFLPGICSALVRTVRGDAKQGHVVIDAAITALTAAIVSTMSNEAYNVAFPEQQVQEQVEERPLDQDQNGRGRQHVETAAVAATAAAHESSEQKLKVLQTEEWWSATTEEIRSVLEKVSAAAAAHPHWSTRKAFITMAEALLTRSGRPLYGK